MTPTIRVTVTERNGRRHASTEAKWEPIVGYSRAVRTGNRIAVSGTLGIEADGSFAPSPKAQARRALEIILAALEALGGKASDVVRTRTFVTDIRQWPEIGEAHGEVFGQIRPATSMVEVSRLIVDQAILGDRGRRPNCFKPGTASYATALHISIRIGQSPRRWPWFPCRPPDRLADRRLDELDAAVAHQDVDAAGVVAARVCKRRSCASMSRRR